MMQTSTDNQEDDVVLPPTRLGKGAEDTQFWLRGLKVAGGEETLRYEATLMQGANVVARVSNDGHGGECNISPQGCDDFGRLFDDLSRAADETLDPIQVGNGESIPWGWCGGLCSLAGNTQLVKKMKRQARTNTLFLHPGESLDVAYRMVKGTDEGTVAWLKEKVPGARILNPALLPDGPRK